MRRDVKDGPLVDKTQVPVNRILSLMKPSGDGYHYLVEKSIGQREEYSNGQFEIGETICLVFSFSM